MSRRTATKTMRVAIYTRQSVSDELEFNSLEAQRQAVERYVESQGSEGWLALPGRYDDAGLSGGSTERPALRKLLDDVEAGDIDIVAVYKLDRLSRSLGDFVGLLDLFERHSVAFVSTTQAFDTSTSLGRMTVNLLATFATYERDMIRERTKDKMAATRRRGEWTGGRPVLGFDLVDRRLVVNEREAKTVRTIFDLYLELRSPLAVVEELNRRGSKTKSFTSKSGKVFEGRTWEKAALYRVLKSPLYVAQVRYGGELHVAANEAIVDAETWAEAQEHMALRRTSSPRRVRRRTEALLAGLLHCGRCGSAMFRHYAAKGSRRFVSYVCARYQKQGAAACPQSRVALETIERAVVEKLCEVGATPELLGEEIRRRKGELQSAIEAAERTLESLAASSPELIRKRDNLLDAVADGGRSAMPLLSRLAELEREIEAAEAEREAAAEKLAKLHDESFSESELRAALDLVGPRFDGLSLSERARILRLLSSRVVYDAASGEVEIGFHAGGIRLAAQGEGREAE